MIPLRSTERVYSTAAVTTTLIVLNLLVFLYQVTMSPPALNRARVDIPISLRSDVNPLGLSR